jgi:hypothetical protein
MGSEEVDRNSTLVVDGSVGDVTYYEFFPLKAGATIARQDGREVSTRGTGLPPRPNRPNKTDY